MIDDILEVTRLKSGAVELKTEELRLDELCGDLEERCSQLPNPNGVALRWSRSIPDVVVATDCRKLAVILRNPEMFRGKRVGVVITGGNVDLDKLPWIKG